MIQPPNPSALPAHPWGDNTRNQARFQTKAFGSIYILVFGIHLRKHKIQSNNFCPPKKYIYMLTANKISHHFHFNSQICQKNTTIIESSTKTKPSSTYHQPNIQTPISQTLFQPPDDLPWNLPVNAAEGIGSQGTAGWSTRSTGSLSGGDDQGLTTAGAIQVAVIGLGEVFLHLFGGVMLWFYSANYLLKL